jgi:hypothetical protein
MKVWIANIACLVIAIIAVVESTISLTNVSVIPRLNNVELQRGTTTYSQLFTSIATDLADENVAVYCHAPDSNPNWDGVVGWTFYEPNRIFLRYCKGTARLVREDVDTLAHEILHVKHPFWSEGHVRQEEHAFGAIVLKALEKAENKTRPLVNSPSEQN